MRMKWMILSYITLVMTGCYNKSNFKSDTTILSDTINISSNNILELNDKKNFKNEEEILNVDVILNKTFYYISHTDSGDFVIDFYQNGLNGFIITTNKIINFGSETFCVNIDSIASDCKRIVVYVSSEYTDIFGEKTKETGSYSFEPKIKRTGIFIVDSLILMVDSIYAGKTIPIVKEEPYDIKEAIGDF